jgi:hypothetical protein
VRVLSGLALAQLRHHLGRTLLLVAGIALVVAVPIASSGLAAEVRAQSITRTINELSPADRALLVTLEGDTAGAAGGRIDHTMRTQLARLTGFTPRREMQFRRLVTGGQQYILGASDRLPGAVRVTSGRLPQTCTPRHCEVVQLGASITPALAVAVRSIGVSVVGSVTRTDPELFTGQLDPGNAQLLLGADVGAMNHLAKLSLFSRFLAWTAPIDAARVTSLGVPAYVGLGADVDAALVKSVYSAVFIRPDQALIDADQRAQVSTRRFGLLAGLAAALLLGFAVVAAGGLRRETALLVSVLRRRGASAGQIGVVVAGQAVLASLAGAILGTAIGATTVAIVADKESGATAVSDATRDAAPAAAILCGLAGLVVTAVLLWPDARARGLWRTLDLLALFSLGAAVLAVQRGRSDLSSGSDPLVVALPVLTALIAGLVAARLWSPLAQAAAWLLPRGSVAGRIGLLGLLRRPLRPAATVAFLTAAVASVVFAGAYRSTLLVGDADQAAYQIPMDAMLTTQRDGPTPTALLDRYGAPGGTQVYPVLDVSGAVTRLAGVVDAVPVVGLDPGAIARVQRWSRTTGSSESAADIAAALQAPPAPSGPQLPANAQTVRVAASGIDQRTVVTFWVATTHGRELGVALHRSGDALVGAIPDVGATLHVVAIGIDVSADYLDRQQHATGEGNNDQPTVTGTLHIAAITVDGAPLPVDWASWGADRGSATPARSGLTMQYRLAGRSMVAVPSYSAAAAQLPVVVDPGTAEAIRAGVLTLTLDGSVPVNAEVVGVLPRLPATGGSFVLADRSALARTLDRGAPGRTPTQAWAAGATAPFAAGPWTELSVVDRAAVQAHLDSDPIGRGARLLLMIVALLALGVAAVALVLLVIGERRDGAGELFAWEADGVRPGVLRRMLVVRLAIVALTAIPVGVLAGLLLAEVGTDLIAVDASGSTPTPPLSVTLGSVWTPIALVIGVGAGVLLGWLVAARSLRERYPVDAEADLR